MLDELVSSLLYEGYALYPYTPGSTKNATPTPFGIVYPPRYAAECAGAFDHARLECTAAAPAGATLTATLRYLRPSGERHQAQEQCVELGPVPLGERRTVEFAGGRFTVRGEAAPGGARSVVRACVHNSIEVPAGLERGDALLDSLISTHIVLRLSAGCFISPLETAQRSVNIWPVLAAPGDDVMLGAAIILPDHPQIAPQSRGNLFDNTEIEEALVLHVHALSDGEQAAAASQDAAVGDMLERALATTPDEIMSLHGGMKPVDSHAPGPTRGHQMSSEDDLRQSPAAQLVADDNPGEERATVDGVTFEKGATVVLRPGTDRDVLDRMLDGRSATLERIYVDYDDRVHLAVTVNDDPGQALMRETGRYLFFFPNEVQIP